MSLEPSTDAVPPISPPTKASQAHRAMMHRRIEDVVKLRLAGCALAEVCAFVRQQEQVAGSAWFVGPDSKSLSGKSIRRYLTRADRDMVTERKATRQQMVNRHLEQRRDLYRRCLEAKDHGTALNVLKDEATLRGLYPPTKIAPTNPEGDQGYEGGLEHIPGLAPLLIAFRAAIERRRAVLAEEATGKTARDALPDRPEEPRS